MFAFELLGKIAELVLLGVAVLAGGLLLTFVVGGIAYVSAVRKYKK
jgi:hypothetical protein